MNHAEEDSKLRHRGTSSPLDILDLATTSAPPRKIGLALKKRSSSDHFLLTENDHDHLTPLVTSRSEAVRRDIFSQGQEMLDPLKKIAIEMKGAILASGLASCSYLLYWLKPVLVPFFLAIFLMYLVDPLVELLDVSPKYFCCICTRDGRQSRRSSRGCSRAFASLLAVLLVSIFFALVG